MWSEVNRLRITNDDRLPSKPQLEPIHVPPAGQNLIGADQSARDYRYAGLQQEADGAASQRLKLTVPGTLPFGEDTYTLSSLDEAERHPDGLWVNLITPCGNSAYPRREPGHEPGPEYRTFRQREDEARAKRVKEQRIQVTLVAENEEEGPLFGDVIFALEPNLHPCSKVEAHRPPKHPIQHHRLFPRRTLRHRSLPIGSHSVTTRGLNSMTDRPFSL